jgi:hypothetical protein
MAGEKVYQRSMSDEHKEWEIAQTVDTITRGNVHFSMKSLRAELMTKYGAVATQMPQDNAHLAHANSSMTRYACHTSWTPTCFGCHLQMIAKARKPMLHNEGHSTRNYTSYNFQVLRDDIYMLGVDGTVTGDRIAPARSACAALVSSQNANREWLYYTKQTISVPGFSGFSPDPTPKLIATAHTHSPALAISKGIDRDRAVDESGNQLAVFGRRGARPLNRTETRALYVHSLTNQPYTVSDEPEENIPGTSSENSKLDRFENWMTALIRGPHK